ncbi:MAG: DUF6145 family protein [Velocimicrobium sp.]
MYKNIVLCGCSAYEQKFYLDEKFAKLPEAIIEELKIMCVLYTADVGGVLTMEFDVDGTLLFQVTADEGDLLFDEIGSALKMKQVQREKQELFEALELYYRAFILREDMAKLLTDEDE